MTTDAAILDWYWVAIGLPLGLSILPSCHLAIPCHSLPSCHLAIPCHSLPSLPSCHSLFIKKNIEIIYVLCCHLGMNYIGIFASWGWIIYEYLLVGDYTI
jgi:hypothetical protein